MKSLKIGFCINSMDKGGAERVVSVLANDFVRDNDIDIIMLTDNPIKYNLDDNINLIKLTKKNVYHTRSKFFLIPKIIGRTYRLSRVMKENKYDVIIAFLPEASFLASLANRHNIPLIISERSDPVQEYSSLAYSFFMKLLYNKATGLVFQTRTAQSYFDNILKRNIKKTIIYNPVDKCFINEKRYANSENFIVAVGRLSAEKNFRTLIKAFSKIGDSFPNYSLKICGEGKERKNLEKLIDELNLKDRVSLLGNISDVYNIEKRATLFVMSSNYEGMPNALVEAMALGLPVIATKCPCGGPEEIIEDGVNGKLVPVDDCDSLANAIEILLNNLDLSNRMGEKARLIIKKVDHDVICNEWKLFIDKCISNEGEKNEHL